MHEVLILILILILVLVLISIAGLLLAPRRKVYLPPAHAVTDTAKLHDFMRRHSFATLITGGQAGLFASHLPVLLDPDVEPAGRLFGHMARANSQWRDARGEVLVVFSGPHTYISPSWYEEEGTVPTWNYAVVHAYGTFETIEDRDSLLDILREASRPMRAPDPSHGPSTSRRHMWIECSAPSSASVSRSPGSRASGSFHKITPTTGECGVIQALESRDDDDAKAIALMMKEEMAGGS